MLMRVECHLLSYFKQYIDNRYDNIMKPHIILEATKYNYHNLCTYEYFHMRTLTFKTRKLI